MKVVEMFLVLAHSGSPVKKDRKMIVVVEVVCIMQ